ncbi:MAG: ABC transporter permease, partial [Mucilaginibacter sp.]
MSLPKQEITQDLFVHAPLKSSINEDFPAPPVTFWSEAWGRLKKNRGAFLGLVMIFLFSVMSLVGPLLSDHSFKEQDLARSNLSPKVAGLGWIGFDGKDVNGKDQYESRGITENFWFGTDEFGRDLWTRVWKATQISLFIAIIAAVLDLIIGVVYGGISAFYGGWVDNAMQRVIEVLIGIPNLIVIILFILILEPGITSIILAMVITGWV